MSLMYCITVSLDELWEPAFSQADKPNLMLAVGGPHFEEPPVRVFLSRELGRASLRIERTYLVGASNSATDIGRSFDFLKPCPRYMNY